MGVIEWIEHPDRVHDARDAAALLRTLGVERVRMTHHRSRSWVLKSPVDIDRVLRKVEPDSRTEVEIEGITREATLPWIERLVRGDARFISIAGNKSWLRTWPQRDEAFLDGTAIPRAHAFERFRRDCTLTWINASVSEPSVDAVACLPQIFAELDQPELEIELDLELDSARSLVEAFPTTELEWVGGTVIQFPAGTVATYKLSPPAGFEVEWRATITAAFAKARSSPP